MDTLNRTYINTDIVSKTLMSLLKSQEAKVMTIKEVKDLTKLPLKELIDSLITHEITMEKQELDKKPNKNLTFKTMHHVDSDDDDDDDEVEENIALITSQF